MLPEPVLAIRDLRVTLHRDGRPVQVLDQIKLEVAAGEIVALVGESGSGKSTLGLSLQGLLPGEADPLITGSIRIAGAEIVGAKRSQLQAARRKLVRAVPQDPMVALNPTMKVGRQLTESASGDRLILDWLSRTGLTEPARIASAFPHQLSGGQRQRVLIAMAMIAEPRLLIADEPSTALDVTTQAQVLELLRSLARQQHMAIVFITHDLAVATNLADRIAVLHGGRIVEAGPTRSLIAAPSHPYTHGLLASRFSLSTDRTRPLGPGSAWPPQTVRDNDLALRLSAVGKSYPIGRRTMLGRRRHEPVLTSIDLSIRLGECVALVGESGAGKSTVLRIAAGLVGPDSGKVTRADRHPQIVFQDPAASLTPWLTIGAQIGDRISSLTDRAGKVRRALELVGLDSALASARPGELSLGQCQRAALARAMIVPPKLLLCDEPVSAMDVPLAGRILDLLGDLRRRLGMAMLFVTHDLAAARLVADRIAVLRAGAIVEQADVDTLISAPAHAYTRSLIDAVPSIAVVR